MLSAGHDPRLTSSPADFARRGELGRVEKEKSAVQVWRLFDCHLSDGYVDRFLARAHDLDSLIFAKFASDQGFSKVGLPVHETGARITKIAGSAHD